MRQNFLEALCVAALSLGMAGFKRICIVPVLIPFPSGAAPNPQQIFDRVRENVGRQLKKSSNYTCVLTVERDYYSPLRRRGCVPADSDRVRLADVVGRDKTLFMHDRLRLDVAVSSGAEIFSWHGSKVFSSRGVGDVVKSGPISSGAFVGYLENVFFKKGVQVSYRIPTGNDGRFHFTYDVPLRASDHHIMYGGDRSADSGERSLTAFHGEFSVDDETFELSDLSTVIDRPPRRSKICFAKSEVRYKTVPISDAEARIASSFQLDTEDENGFSTSSHSNYQACRAFTGESTVSYDTSGDSGLAQRQQAEEAPLPKGMRLSIAVRSAVDDIHSFAGDSVEGVLSQPVHIPKTGVTLPRGAAVSGVITRLETRYQPVRHYVMRIRFDRLTSGNSAYSMQATAADSEATKLKLRSLYGGTPPADIKEDFSHGVLLWTEAHFRLNEGVPLEFVTETVSEDTKH